MVRLSNMRNMISSGSKVITAEPPVKTKVQDEVQTSVEQDTQEDSHVYVHCYLPDQWKNMLVRIWKTTYLIDHSSGSRSKLIHAENISFAPVWTPIPDGGSYSFLLIFSALPKSCTIFDLIEDVAQSGNFHAEDIVRNETDVYHIDLNP